MNNEDEFYDAVTGGFQDVELDSPDIQRGLRTWCRDVEQPGSWEKDSVT